MSQRERKSKGDPDRALPNLPKFLQGKPKPPESPPAPADSSSSPSAKPDPPVPKKAKAPASTPVPPSPRPAKPASPRPTVTAPPASADAKASTAKATSRPAPKAPAATAPKSPVATVPTPPSGAAAPETAPLAKKSPAAKSPAAPKTPPDAQSPAAETKSAPATVSDSDRAQPRKADAHGSPGGDVPTGPQTPATEPIEPDAPSVDAREGFADDVSDDVLPQAVSFAILREAMAAEKQFRPVLFAGPLKRVAKKVAHDPATTSDVAVAASSPAVAVSAPAPVSDASPIPERIAARRVEAPDEAPSDEIAASATPAVRPALEESSTDAASADDGPVAEAHEDASNATSRATEIASDAEPSNRDRDRQEARRRKQVSSILAAAANRARSASGSETASGAESDRAVYGAAFSDPWEHLRAAVAAAPHGDGPAIRTDEDQREDEVTPERIVRRAPPFAVSLVLHVVGLVLLALLILPEFQGTAPLELDLNYATEDSELLEAIELDLPTEVALDTSDPFSSDLSEVADPMAGALEMPEAYRSFDLLTPGNVAQASVGFSGRDAGTKQALLEAFGGTIATEDAVKLGLGWMRRQQQPDGRWLLSGPYSNGCSLDNPAAATSMAMLAFLGDGHTPEEGDFKQTMTKGAEALLRFQDSDGNFYVGPDGQHRLYTQAQATIAVCELYGMTGDPRYRDAAKLAVEYCVGAQAPEGGWRYYPGQESDTSVTGWFVMALKSAEMANVDVPPEAFDRISAYLDRVQDEEGWQYKYRIIERDYSKTMTAEAVLCRQYLGWDRDDLRMRKAVDYLLRSPIRADEREVYYWYYASQTLHHYGGPEWDAWNAELRETLPAIQEKKGREQGSWSPRDDEWGSVGGRLFMTSLCLYTLEIYYRHLPLYQQAAEESTATADRR